MKKFLIIDEILKDSMGHFLEYDQSVIESLSKENLKIDIITNKAFKGNLNGAHTHPVFAENLLDKPVNNPIKLIWKLVHYNFSYYKLLVTYISKSPQKIDFIFIPTLFFNYHLLPILFFLLKKKNFNKFGAFLIVIRNDLYPLEGNLFKKIITYILIRLNFLFLKPKVVSGRVFLFTDSQHLASKIKQIADLKPKVLPIPHSKTDENKISSNSSKITFSCLGPARYEKGIDLLLKAINLLVKSEKINPKHVQFIIQTNNFQELQQDIKDQINQLSLLKPMVNFIKKPLTRTEYENYLATTDVMILPYRKRFYKNRTSGIAVEAMSLAIPIIYTKETWLETEIAKFGIGIGVENENVNDIKNAILNFFSEYNKYKIKAIDKSLNCKKFHNKENFHKILIGC